MTGLMGWTPRPRPAREALEGRLVRLEPLEPSVHGDDLFAASMGDGTEDRFRFLFDAPCERPAFAEWLARSAMSVDPLFFAVIEKATGRTEGRQALMRIEPAHGVVEIGNILWGPAIARRAAATEALHLVAAHVFDKLGYRRLEWKCDALNAPSRRAALRFGFRFEGVFRQHMVVKGQNRDTAWFAMTDEDWPGIGARQRAWLDPANFDAEGRQKRRLEDC